ncbi:hypothetical protein [Photobacterium leiognathi]|uniref:hypothetical protein n=1 Tax=Photobacterium leiognathi TaxID=553611 RepID=UPI0029819A9B|nr:hypothetical protein [Photobacterium leiognathi]
MTNSTSTPLKRIRRMRRSANMRDLVRENEFKLADLIHPIFIEETLTEEVPISTMPGISRIPETMLADEVKVLYKLGVRYVMPFGISHTKDEIGSDTWNDDGLLARMVKTIKAVCPDMMVIPDICFCEYTTHGHCGVYHDEHVLNDENPVLLNRISYH